MDLLIGFIALFYSSFLLLLSIYLLFKKIPQEISGWESGLALFALRVVYTLIIGGFLLAFLSLAYLMGITPSF